MARLDRLDDAPKRAIQMASVIGREFALRLLARITEAGDGVSALVDELRALELIYEKAAHPELAYMFKHALTHDVAYESVLVQRRSSCTARSASPSRSSTPTGSPSTTRRSRTTSSAPRTGSARFDYHARAAEKALDRFANRAVDRALPRRRSRSPTGSATRVAGARRQALEERLGAASLLRERVRRLGRGVRARRRARRRARGRATSTSSAPAYSFTLGPRATTRARAMLDDGAARSPARHGSRAAEALALAHRGLQRRRHAPATSTAIEPTARARRSRIGDATPAARTRSALARFMLGEAPSGAGDYRARDRARRAGDRGRRGGCACRTSSSGRTWFLGKARCCLGDYGARDRDAARGARALRPHRRPRLEDAGS